jgi:hypothetical protein
MEARWHDAPPLPRATVQLYGLEVIDPDGIDRLDPCAVRTVFITEGPDEGALLARPECGPAFEFDAAATVEHGWAPFNAAEPRPGSFTARRRMLTVRVLGVRP